MSAEILPTTGRVALAAKAVASSFLFAISRGDPAWDAAWTGANPPTPALGSGDVLDTIGFARPTIVDFLTPDDAGAIYGKGGARYSVSGMQGEEPTRYLRVRLSLPVGTFAGETIREIGLFIDPTIDAAVPIGATVVPADGVLDRGRLFYLHWREALPVEDGDHFARNFVVRL